jgi:hypothetical protein
VFCRQTAEEKRVIPKVFHVLILFSMLVSIAWGEPIRISPPQVKTGMHRPGIRESAAVADSNGVVHVAFQAFSQELGRKVIMYASVGPGERAVRTELLTGGGPAVLPDLVWTKEGLYVAWSEQADKSGAIGFASSKDGGKTWVKTVLPLQTQHETAVRLLAGSGGDVFVYGSARAPGPGKQDHEIFCFRSTDGGKLWTSASPTLDLEGQSTDPFMIEVKPGHLAMAWVQTDGRSWRVTTRRSSDGGQTWESAELADDNARFPAAEPSLIPVGKRLIALWVETTASGKRLVADAFENGAWGKDRVLSGKEVTEVRYDASSDGKEIRVAYLAKSGSGSLCRSILPGYLTPRPCRSRRSFMNPSTALISIRLI